MCNKIIIDDGFNAEFVETAFFDGGLEMPCIERPEKIVIPKGVIPFSQRNKSKDIRRAGEHVAGLKSNRHAPSGVTIWGVYKGVRVGVIKTNGSIGTVFPDSNQPDRRKKR